MTTERKVRAKRAPAKRVGEKRSWEKILDRSKRLSDADIAFHPRDGAANSEHYLYGTPKQDP
jgi:hypothetical protein